MENQFCIEVFAEEELGLVAKILLYLERKQIKMHQMNLVDSTKDDGFKFSFLFDSNKKEVESTSLFISKQVGVMNVHYRALNAFVCV